MLQTSQEVLITLIAGTFLLLFLVVIVIVAAMRYQNRKRTHLIDVQRMKHEQEREILKSTLEAQEQTLNQLSRELHDNVGQLLSSTKLLIGVAKRALTNPMEELQLAEDTVAKAITELRALSKSLNKDWLEQFDFIQNLNAEARRINATNEFEMTIQHPEIIYLPSDRQLILFRIVQEAFQNSLKHGKASQINIRVEQVDVNLHVMIEDNGKGFDVSDSSQQGVGMINIKNRAQMLGGSAKWQSNGSGTAVKVQIPIQEI